MNKLKFGCMFIIIIFFTHCNNSSLDSSTAVGEPSSAPAKLGSNPKDVSQSAMNQGTQKGVVSNAMASVVGADRPTPKRAVAPAQGKLATTARRQKPIVTDHTAIKAFDRIPDEWIEAAKQLTYYYARRSHGAQITAGMDFLEQKNPKYRHRVKTHYEGGPGLPKQGRPIAVRSYDDGAGEMYHPSGYWEDPVGLDRTRKVLRLNGGRMFNFTVWTWCDQLISKDRRNPNRPFVASYLRSLEKLESEFPEVIVVYNTAHTWTGDKNSIYPNLAANNRKIREYAIRHNKVLFDFENLDTHDPNGVPHFGTSDECDWCIGWCKRHPEDCPKPASSCGLKDRTGKCLRLPDCRHSGGTAKPGTDDYFRKYNCVHKAKAFWWMMARMVGWDGN